MLHKFCLDVSSRYSSYGRRWRSRCAMPPFRCSRRAEGHAGGQGDQRAPQDMGGAPAERQGRSLGLAHRSDGRGAGALSALRLTRRQRAPREGDRYGGGATPHTARARTGHRHVEVNGPRCDRPQ
ncbi:hypothetical protein J2R87_009047 [Bradyrhizobium elkanii]|nr:hypothetical protein [Bradyrhizobium elkanii]MCS3522425.1 hypothetical protein [Bradyrhizobium elkanii]MCS3617785.1 hypothetical protein [Bradyrhizobium elkanii]MCS4070079.1 hypothetical protein [Bradyrhizobium elkanii]MCS4076710.1 hypothetical protein [Bradyrhizobium elkanii]